MRLKRCLYSAEHPAGPSVGKDVEILKHGIHRYETGILPRPKDGYSQEFGEAMREAVVVIQKSENIPATGNIGHETFDVIWQYLSPYQRWRYSRFVLPIRKPLLVEPKQGFESLHRSLWPLYSLGRRMGLSDLGTYNPASRLPSGARSDHAVYPALAFDLGIEPDTGWQNGPGRNFVYTATHDPNVEYVILGNMIWSQSRGLHVYTSGGHMNHVHVSGRG